MATGCQVPPATAAEKPACCATNLAPAPSAPDNSLYQLESTWTTDAGAAIKLETLRGKVQVVTMFFANCSYACPVLLHDMKRIEDALPADVRARAGFVLVSFDSVRDTPAALRAYRQKQGLPSDRWTLLHGQPDDVLELAALLGVKFKQDASGNFAHSNLITVLTPAGEIAHQQIGLNQDPAPTVSMISRLASR